MPKDEPMDNEQEVCAGFIFWDENPWNFFAALAEKGSNVEVQLSSGLISLTQLFVLAWVSAASISDNLFTLRLFAQMPCDGLETLLVFQVMVARCKSREANKSEVDRCCLSNSHHCSRAQRLASTSALARPATIAPYIRSKRARASRLKGFIAA